MFKCHLIYINTAQLPAESMKTRGVQRHRHFHTHTLIHAGAFALTLTLCCIVKDSSVFCNGSEICIKVGFSGWAAKGTEKLFLKGHKKTVGNSGFKDFRSRGMKRNWKRISEDLSELGECIRNVSVHTHKHLSVSTSLLLSSLYADTKKRKPLKC